MPSNSKATRYSLTFRQMLLGWVCCGVLSSLAAAQAANQSASLFDGETLDAWSFLDAEAEWWSVQDGMITGGSLEREVPHNTFLASRESFQNFDLRFQIRVRTTGGFANSGVQIRTQRRSEGSEVIGYQVDVGNGYWGDLYDESRRGRIQQAAAREEIVASIDDGGWNTYRILAEGPRIQSWINGIHSTDYTELENNIPLDGRLAIQVHGGGKVEVQVKDLEIERLPDTPGALTWETFFAEKAIRDQARLNWRSPENERLGFTVPEGFVVELVASEEHVLKLVDIAFDDAGRMWGLTAAEYPIDGNEDPTAAEKYKGGGRDMVVVFDNIWSDEIEKPRVFADGLAMPMAILPDGNSILLGHGPEILRLTDEDGDGKSDRREVLLSGFGIDDSHLMPHRFVRAPGDWIYMAQGAFNYSKVKTTSGDETVFNNCKLARFRGDGSAFEIVGIGFNNIWGIVLDRRGDMWIQEANDYGYPLIPAYHGASYPGIGGHKFHPSSPWQPPIAATLMGGTGLSGLAHSQDRNGFPAPWDQLFMVANPILNSVQTLRVEPHDRPSDRTVTKTEDFVVSADKNFRPVAVHYGPDGCLYIVDWYNPIISHNEVPRDHADRDKDSTRVWRVRHESQSTERPLDVTGVATALLPGLLDSDSTWISRAAWHQIGSRKSTELAPELQALAKDSSVRPEARMLALWSLEDLGVLTPEIVRAALLDGESTIVREGARLSAGLNLPANELAEILSPLAKEEHPAVRRAAIASLALQDPANHSCTLALLDFLRAPLTSPVAPSRAQDGIILAGMASEVAFERSLVRIALEERRAALASIRSAPAMQSLPMESRLLAALSLGTADGAVDFATLLGELGRMPNSEELEFIGKHLDEPAVERLLFGWLDRESTSEAALRGFLGSRFELRDGPVADRIVSSLRMLTADEAGAEQVSLALEVARFMRLTEFETDVIRLLDGGRVDPNAALSTLLEIGCQDAKLFHGIAVRSVPGGEGRRRAVAALGSINSEPAFELLLSLWFDLESSERKAALTETLASAENAERVLAALEADDIDADSLGGVSWAQLEQHFGDDSRLSRLQASAANGRVPCLRLGGGGEDFGDANLTIEGAFTMESWMYLEPGISRDDSLLALPGQFDFNFYDGYARLWGGGGVGDVIIASRRSVPQHWFHIAVTRDDDGLLKLYLDGQLDKTSDRKFASEVEGLDIGRSSGPGNTHGSYAELRLWNAARSEEQIGSSYRRSFSRDEDVKGLVFSSSRQEFSLVGQATIEPAFDAPPLQTAAEAAAQHARFDAYRTLANAEGDSERGREVFAANCLACHQVGNDGGSIGPVLDGAGTKGIEGLLRSIVTPNAGVESGYRSLLVQTVGGELLVGYLAGEDTDSILVRRQDREDLWVLRSEIESMRFDSLSIMPEGLLDALEPQQATDLFKYLDSLR